ncbi:3210_t:CDS:2, partial [Entrophospora sp. SA101]
DSEFEYFLNKSKRKGTVNSTKNWINHLENFRKDCNCNCKIENIDNINDLERQLINYIIKMKRDDGSDYSSISIKTFVSAVARHLANNSVIDRIDIYNKQIFKKLWEVIDGKLWHLDELGNGESHGSDSFTKSEIISILQHPYTSKTNPIDGSFEVLIYLSKANQRGLSGGLADNLLIPYDKEIMDDYDLYFSKRPKNAEPAFYLHPVKGDKEWTLLDHWYQSTHIGQTKLKSWLKNIAIQSGIDL